MNQIMLSGVLGKDYAGQHCCIARALELVGERWTLLIMRDAFYGVRRFSDFATRLDVPRAVLADRLRGLVETGLLEQLPVEGTYVLTEHGRALWPVLHALGRWGARFIDGPPPRRFVHDACRTALDEHGACPRCGHAPAPEAILTTLQVPPTRNEPVTEALRHERRLLEPLDAPPRRSRAGSAS